MLALIGARAGSKRLPGKNLRLLGGRPLVVYTLHAAFDADCFSHVVLSTDSEEIAKTALDWCGKSLEVIIRPAHMAQDDSPDIEWVKHAWDTLMWREDLEPPLAGCILRPTSPFRDANTIHRALQLWEDIGHNYASLRSMRRVTEHPLKMWGMAPHSNYAVFPIALRGPDAEAKSHDQPTQVLPPVYVQTGGLEIHHRSTIQEGSISGDRVAGFILEGSEALDINSPEDWARAEAILPSWEMQEPWPLLHQGS